LLAAEHDEVFADVLNQADLAVPDGVGLFWAGLAKGAYLRRWPGADLVVYILERAGALGLRIAILNWQKGLSNDEQIKQVVNKLSRGSRVRVFPVARPGVCPVGYSDFQPQVVLITLGAPWQDLLAARLRDKGGALRLVMGVGGSFDFLTGQTKRAPQLWRSLGMEWLWRLALYPRKRLKRVVSAVILFPWRFIRRDLINRYLYRPNVVGFIVNQANQVLLVNSNKEPRDFWKLPQGGIEAGEKIVAAAKREMAEELSLTDLELTVCLPHVFKYRWPKHYDLGGYKGQEQSLCFFKYQGEPDAIQLSPENKGYKWVPLQALISEADPVTREAYNRYINLYYKHHQIT
jgi:N-acetylglucosaminyldiphosphoundecaprenol N-acetyl-beta-D-mannosaminyltransferase